ncbi:MAG: FG-GAP repeat protein [Candidatus Methanofastidiosum methylothiophilum]|uniref:FG-GAP repeat protein n=1 Tax=Candidatus Methanofastidiosum methylothiophilum TaxID=1705564 RepID=A0A150IX01_9EURY|nr:MAG: FG-GAP repeat protein [Candidatus Methanofastidiosum methylthiophilus]KYC46794.1 MAG: FG-GAP repeat protein [Candidatus Methanofastidiosum methylthiophilus]KYC49490.1 MAG: FG-GAP repeat protein [Candidatus Methanofastidiosum methylthiophilus]
MVQKMQKILPLILTFIFIFATFSHVSSEDLIKWRHHTNEEVKGISLGDFDGDGRFDVVVGSGDHIYVLDGSGKEIWKRKTINLINSISAGDLDGDGRSDIAVGLINNGIEVFNSDGEKLWEYWMRTPIQKIIIKDIDSDGYGEVISISHNRSFMDNAWVIINHDGCVRFQSKDLFFPDFELKGYYSGISKKWEADNELRILILEDINGDGYAEFITSTRLNDLIVFDYNRNPLWGYHFDYPITSLSLGDIEKDGFKEILLGVNKKLIILTKDGFKLKEYSFDGDVKAATSFKDDFNTSFVLVGKDNTLLAYNWDNEIFSHKFDGNIQLINYDDLDYKNEVEIIVGTNDGVYVLNTKGKRLFSYRTYSPVIELLYVNLDYKSQKELIIASTDVDAITYQELKDVQIPTPQNNQQQREETIRTGNAIFSTAKALYDVGDYQAAISKFQEARTIYQSVSYTEGINNSSTFISNSALYMQAKAIENQALSFKNERKYPEARATYQAAKDFYSGMNDTVKTQEMDQKITEIDDLIRAESLTRLLLYGGIIVIVVGVIGVLFFFFRKRKKSKQGA